MKTNNRITYRFDRAGNAISDKGQGAAAKPEANAVSQSDKVVPLYPSYENHSVSEHSPWNSPFQDDIGALEQLIRDTSQEADKSSRSDSSAVLPMQVPSRSSSRHVSEDSGTGEPAFSKKVKNEMAIKAQGAGGHAAEPALPSANDAGPKLVKPAELEHVPPPASVEPETARSLHEDEEFVLTGNDEEHSIPAARSARYEQWEAPYRHQARSHKPANPSWIHVFLSVAAALATGALFGYFLLSLFTGASLWSSGPSSNGGSLPASGSVDTVKDGKSPPAGSDTTKSDNGEAASPSGTPAQTVALKGLDQTYYMLQFGVFNTAEGRDTALAQLAAKGLASATLLGTTPFRVYAGMAVDQGNAETIRSQMPDTELYIKPVSLQTPARIAYAGAAEDAQSFFEATKELVYMLDELTLTQLEQPSLSPLGESAAQAWQTKYAEWTKKAETLRIGIANQQGEDYAAKLVEAVQSAAKSMEAYDRKPTGAQLWLVQTSLMESILIQKEWFDSISAL